MAGSERLMFTIFNKASDFCLNTTMLPLQCIECIPMIIYFIFYTFRDGLESDITQALRGYILSNHTIVHVQ